MGPDGQAGHRTGWTAAQQMATVFGPTQVLIRAGVRETPAAAVPADVTALTLSMSRENWPAAGMDIEILVSFDGGVNFQSPGPTHIAPFVASPREPVPTPASIGVGWNQDVHQATHVKARSTNPGGNFQSTVKIDALVVQ
jgi:hypothetical protein